MLVGYHPHREKTFIRRHTGSEQQRKTWVEFEMTVEGVLKAEDGRNTCEIPGVRCADVHNSLQSVSENKLEKKDGQMGKCVIK